MAGRSHLRRLLWGSICCVVVQSLSRVRLFCDPLDCSSPGSSVHGISQAEYWSGLPFSSLGDLPNPEIELMSPALQADSLPLKWGLVEVYRKLFHKILFRYKSLLTMALPPVSEGCRSCSELFPPKVFPSSNILFFCDDIFNYFINTLLTHIVS